MESKGTNQYYPDGDYISSSDSETDVLKKMTIDSSSDSETERKLVTPKRYLINPIRRSLILQIEQDADYKRTWMTDEFKVGKTLNTQKDIQICVIFKP
jgi:hypothetical protein